MPAVGFYELGPAPVEVAQIVLAGFCLGDVHDRPRNMQPLPFIFLGLEAVALLVAVGVAPRDRPAAGGMPVVPDLLIVQLGHAVRGTREGVGIVAETRE